jgi:hypothetical protein
VNVQFLTSLGSKTFINLKINSYAYHNLKNEKWGYSDISKYWKSFGGDKTYITIKTLLGDQNDTKLRKLLKESPGLNTVNPEDVTLEPSLENKSVI